MQMCAITGRHSLAPAGEAGGSAAERLRSLAAGWIAGGVDFIQLREKDLSFDEIYSLAEAVFSQLDRGDSKLILNIPAFQIGDSKGEGSGTAAAGGVPGRDFLRRIAAVADGVHFAGWSGRAAGCVETVREAFLAEGRTAVVSVACHGLEEVCAARGEGVDMALFAPVFGKAIAAGSSHDASGKIGQTEGGVRREAILLPGQGLEALRVVCDAAREVRIFALGGVTWENAPSCAAAGAAGVAGIRLFAGAGWRRIQRVHRGAHGGSSPDI